MPRLVLFDDDGREIFAGDVSEANVGIVLGFIRRNVRTFQALAAVKAAWAQFTGLAELPPAPPPPPRRRRAVAVYTPPARRRR